MHGATDDGATITGTPFVAHGDDDGDGDGDGHRHGKSEVSAK